MRAEDPEFHAHMREGCDGRVMPSLLFGIPLRSEHLQTIFFTPVEAGQARQSAAFLIQIKSGVHHV
jgi:hypothetical protein